MSPIAKILGCDFELANALLTPAGYDGNPALASRLLLAQLAGFPRGSGRGHSMEWGRRFFAENGGSAYVDCDHLEINLPEHARAADHAVQVHAGLWLARQAQERAEVLLLPGERLAVAAHVADDQASWGHHLSVQLRRDTWQAVSGDQPCLTGWLATHLATCPIYTGAGRAGAANGRAAVDYQLSQRADWFERFTSLETTHRRGLLNLRDESHAGPEAARLHVIYLDNVLCPVANLLKAGTLQLVLAMAEAGWDDPSLLLRDPLSSAHEVSRDLSLRCRLPLAGRQRFATAVEIQRGLAERAAQFVAEEPAAALAVPGAAAIVECWRSTLSLLADRDLDGLAPRCDAWLKYRLLERAASRRGGWGSSEVRYLDRLFASLDPGEGLFWKLAAAGQVRDMPSPAAIMAAAHDPPTETRAYARAHLLRRFGAEVASMDWSELRFARRGRFWSAQAVLSLEDPSGHSQLEMDPLLESCETLDELLTAWQEVQGATHFGPAPSVNGQLITTPLEWP